MAYYKIHGHFKGQHPLYQLYYGMLARCYNPNNKEYKRYGGRGIKVSRKWLGAKGFDRFVKDMGERPKGYTLDRINGNLSYGKDNCHWATHREQALNRRNSRNTSGYPGVSFYAASHKWTAYIDLPRNPDGKKNRKYLGYYHDLEDAIEARRKAEQAIKKGESPMSQDPQQQPDASDTFEDQIGNVPEENLKAPIKPGVSGKPEIPQEDWDEAHKAKEDLKDEGEQTT